MSIEKKTLSLIHLLRGMSLGDKVGTEDGALELVATYLAEPSTLYRAKTDPKALEAVREQAAAMSSEDAQEVTAYFLARCLSYAQGIQSSLGLAPVDPGAIKKVAATTVAEREAAS